METKRKDVTKEDVERWTALWEKHWESGDYKPWHEVQEVPSQGRSRKITGVKSGRTHHLLSDAEYYVFLLLEYEGSVIEIYEQFPLMPLSKTVQIASERGLKPPKYRHRTIKDESTEKRAPLPNKIMSTDFLVKVDRNGEEVWVAIPVKTKSGIDASTDKNKSVLQKLEVERQYWLDRGVECKCMVKEDINKDLIFNLKWF
ncbi:TnsA endonuclease N-terminal domain-containing protein [Endozoicomonas ascidiicola]|nr:TnsA endonuclease N-terminal domain-containing protein [Endozoicomonas ascidiicola]